MGEDEPPRSAAQAGTKRHVRLEVGAALADQVVADMAGAPGVAGLGRLACALDGAQGDAELPFAGAVGQVLDRLAIAVPAQEVHPPVDAGRIALEHPLDETRRLEVLAPVERRDEAQAGDDVGDRDLRGRLALVLAADRLLRGRALCGEMASTAARTASSRGPYSRTSCSSCTTNAEWISGGSGGGCPWPPASICATYASAARRASRAKPASSTSRRRFSISASLSMLGQAHSSPIVSGATVW